jgi:hypothetical protein
MARARAERQKISGMNLVTALKISPPYRGGSLTANNKSHISLISSLSTLQDRHGCLFVTGKIHEVGGRNVGCCGNDWPRRVGFFNSPRILLK